MRLLQPIDALRGALIDPARRERDQNAALAPRRIDQRLVQGVNGLKQAHLPGSIAWGAKIVHVARD